MHLKKRDLINIIENLSSFENPKIELEQYQTDAISTADLVFHIGFENNDVKDNLVVDLGCGTGNLSIAFALFGADVVGVDIDQDALKIFKKNAKRLDLLERIKFLQADIPRMDITGFYKQLSDKGLDPNSYTNILVITNPPFGVHNRGVDVKFLKKAMEIGDIVYSIHNYSKASQLFLENKISKWGGEITEQSLLYMTLKHTYKFHEKSKKQIKTLVFRIETKPKSQRY